MKLRTPIGIVAPVRTPTGRLAGALSAWEPHELLGHVIALHQVRATADQFALAAEFDILAGYRIDDAHRQSR